jgi:isochorismate pyruvate lyase
MTRKFEHMAGPPAHLARVPPVPTVPAVARQARNGDPTLDPRNDELLQDARRKIDALDPELVRQIAAREQLVREAGRLKADSASVRAPSRVQQVIDCVRAVAAEVEADPDIVEATYRAMIAAFIELELRVHRSTNPWGSHGRPQFADD